MEEASQDSDIALMWMNVLIRQVQNAPNSNVQESVLPIYLR